MPPEEITLALFAASNTIRVLAYLPQIHKAATDRHGASSISFMTWMLFLIANLSTVGYALVNRSDWMLAVCFSINALCCLAILAITCWKRRSSYANRGPMPAHDAARLYDHNEHRSPV
jgi:uncharacterized protein with PQ loop repeat